MRIVYLAHHGSVHTRRWARHFAQRGHEVHVVTCGGGDTVDRDEHGAVLPRPYRVHDLGAPCLGRVGYLLKASRVRRLVRSLRPDVVHAHFVTSNGLLALAAGVQPLVVTAHGDDVLVAPRGAVMRRLVRRVLRASQLITVPSEHMRDAVCDLLGDDASSHEVAVFQYGVETARLAAVAARERSTPAPRDGQRAPGPLRIVSTRALLDLYRVDLLLDALALLRARNVAFVCDVVGDGPQRATLQRRASELAFGDDVVFHGNLDSWAVERIVARADLYVSVAESDGVSIGLLEAMALGAVPVLSDIAANTDWVRDGANGTITAFEAQALADALQRAALLDRAEVARTNLAIVAERADRDVNMAACELLIDGLCGVTWETTPVGERAA